MSRPLRTDWIEKARADGRADQTNARTLPDGKCALWLDARSAVVLSTYVAQCGAADGRALHAAWCEGAGMQPPQADESRWVTLWRMTSPSTGETVERVHPAYPDDLRLQHEYQRIVYRGPRSGLGKVGDL